jgi:hypothetical protein
MSSTVDCRRVHDDLPELALGTLSGLERTSVLVHVQGCTACREEVDRLSGAADALLTLAPAVEPPAGFETRLFERMGVLSPGSFGPGRVLHRLSRRRLASMSAAVAGALGLGLGLAFGLGGAAPVAGPPPPAVVAELTSHQMVKGEVYLAPGHPGWLFMSVHGMPATGLVSCRVQVDGRTVTVGSFYVYAGSGSWAYPLTVPPHDVQAAWLVDQHGTVLASARLTG